MIQRSIRGIFFRHTCLIIIISAEDIPKMVFNYLPEKQAQTFLFLHMSSLNEIFCLSHYISKMIRKSISNMKSMPSDTREKEEAKNKGGTHTHIKSVEMDVASTRAYLYMCNVCTTFLLPIII